MDHRIPKVGAAVSVLLALGALITFVFLNQKFEGPDPFGPLASPYELTARFANSDTLPSKQPVLHKGVSVGRVNAVDYDEETGDAVVTFTLDGDFGPLYLDAKIEIGERSLLGDAYLNLLDRGSSSSGRLETGDEVKGTVRGVRFDEALDFLDAKGRKRVRSLLDTAARGTVADDSGARLNGTIGGVSRTVNQLHLLTDTLRGQEHQISGLVSDSATVLDELGSREAAIRSIVASGRTTLDALATGTDSLQQAIAELPRLLRSGRLTLAEVRPLLVESRPLLRRLADIAPTLTPAFDRGAPFSVGPISSDLVDVIEGLRPQRRVSEVVLPKVTTVNRLSLPVVRGAGPAALNTVPIAGYLAPRINSIGAFYALGSSVVAHSDSVGRYARFGVVGDPGLLGDMPHDGNCQEGSGEPASPGPGFCYNAYPGPDDALDNQPFGGAYPHLFPYQPPDPASLRGDG